MIDEPHIEIAAVTGGYVARFFDGDIVEYKVTAMLPHLLKLIEEHLMSLDGADDITASANKDLKAHRQNG